MTTIPQRLQIVADMLAEGAQPRLPAEPSAVQFAAMECRAIAAELEAPAADAAPSAGLPPREPTKTNEQQGLYGKFIVRRTDGSDAPGGKHHGCEYFVLDVTHDKHSKAALSAYADSVASTHPQLAADMRARWMQVAQDAWKPCGRCTSHGLCRDQIGGCDLWEMAK